MTEVQADHAYGGDVGENPVTMLERSVTVQAGLASASAVPGQAEAEETDSGLD